MMLGLKKGNETRHQIVTIIHEAEAEVKLEIVTTDDINVKALKGSYFNQEIIKTEAQEVKPRIIVKNMNKRKTTSKELETIDITTNVNNRKKNNMMRYALFLRHNSVKTAKVKMCK